IFLREGHDLTGQVGEVSFIAPPPRYRWINGLILAFGAIFIYTNDVYSRRALSKRNLHRWRKLPLFIRLLIYVMTLKKRLNVFRVDTKLSLVDPQILVMQG